MQEAAINLKNSQVTGETRSIRNAYNLEERLKVSCIVRVSPYKMSKVTRQILCGKHIRETEDYPTRVRRWIKILSAKTIVNFQCRWTVAEDHLIRRAFSPPSINPMILLREFPFVPRAEL